LKVNLEGVESNRDGIGSWIEIYQDGQKQVRYTKCGTAYLAQNTQTEHFGLGAFEMLDSVIVRWQSGTIDKFENVAANQILEVLEGMTIVSTSDIFEKKNNFQVVPNPVTEHYFYLKNSFGENLKVDLQLVNTSGQIIFEKKIELEKGENKIGLPRGLNNGIYFLNIKNRLFSERKSIFIIKTN